MIRSAGLTMFFIIVTKSAPSNKCGIENRIAIKRPCRLSSKFILLVECRMHFIFKDNERTTELANCFVCQRNSFFSCGGVFIADDLHYLKLSLNRIEISVGCSLGQLDRKNMATVDQLPPYRWIISEVVG